MGSNDNDDPDEGEFPKSGIPLERLSLLTSTERLVCQLMIEVGDKPHDKVAELLGGPEGPRSRSTVDKHLKNAKQKLGFQSTMAMVWWVNRNLEAGPQLDRRSPAAGAWDPKMLEMLDTPLGPRLVEDD